MQIRADIGSMLDTLRGVKWPTQRWVTSAATGVHRSIRRGSAIEFSEYRPYRQGDDPKRLDWKLLARLDRAYVRVTDDHALTRTTFIVDASASMAFPTANHAKWHLAESLAIGLAAIAHTAGDPIALRVATSGGRVELPFTSRRGAIFEFARTCARITPGGTTRWIEALDHGTVAGGRIVIISDFLDEDALSDQNTKQHDVVSALRAARTGIAAGAEIYAVHVVAKEELDPPAGALRFSDPEHQGIHRSLTRATRADYLIQFASWRNQVRNEWRAAGAHYHMVMTDEPPQLGIRRIVRP